MRFFPMPFLPMPFFPVPFFPVLFSTVPFLPCTVFGMFPKVMTVSHQQTPNLRYRINRYQAYLKLHTILIHCTSRKHLFNVINIFLWPPLFKDTIKNATPRCYRYLIVVDIIFLIYLTIDVVF